MNTPLEGAKAGGKTVSVMGWIYLVLGVLAIVFPFAAGAGVTIAIGIALLIGGLGGTMDAWSHRKHDGWVPVLVGVLTVVAGLMFLFRPWFGMKVLTLMLIIYFGATGLLRIIAAFQLKPRDGWGWVLFDGAVSFILGLMLWMHFPSPAAWLLGLLFGIKLITFGLVMIMTGKAVREIAGEVQERMDAAREVEADVIDTSTQE